MSATGTARMVLNVAVAVMMITCPFALGLPVPAVSTVAAGRVCRAGFLLCHDTGLERPGEVDARRRTWLLADEERSALAALAVASDHLKAQVLAAAIPPADPAGRRGAFRVVLPARLLAPWPR